MNVPRCLSIATSDSGGGAGIQADIKAFAAAGCHGMTAIVGLTAQNTQGIGLIHELPGEVITAQLEALFEDIGVDAAKTGALLSASVINVVAGFLEAHPTPLVVDPVLMASTGGRLLDDAGMDALVRRLFPLATVVTPNLPEARALAGTDGDRRTLAGRLTLLGARAVIITGGHGAERSDLLFDGTEYTEIPVAWVDSSSTHGSGCTHSATLTAEIAAGIPLLEAARRAALATEAAIRHGLGAIGGGSGPVDVLQVSSGASQRVRTK